MKWLTRQRFNKAELTAVNNPFADIEAEQVAKDEARRVKTIETQVQDNTDQLNDKVVETDRGFVSYTQPSMTRSYGMLWGFGSTPSGYTVRHRGQAEPYLTVEARDVVALREIVRMEDERLAAIKAREDADATADV
jgi:hypothetical protein